MKSFTEYLNENKSSKIEAKYQAHPYGSQKCNVCTMWRPPNKCSSVSGNIDPDGWCVYFKKSHRKE